MDVELTAYLQSLSFGLGREERREAMGDYVTGLLLDGERKSMQPISQRLVQTPAEAEAMRQHLQQCVCIANWSDEEMSRRVALKAEQELPDVAAFVMDDTGIPKKGKESVGVARQYSGTLGRTENCQVLVSLHLGGEQGSVCINRRLYLPEDWTNDRARCRRAGVPEDVAFKTKWRIGLDLLDKALEWGLKPRPVLADCGYGDCCEFRRELTHRGLSYAVGVSGAHLVWPPWANPKPPQQTGRGRPRTRYTAGNCHPISMLELAKRMRVGFRQVTWRDGSKGPMSSRFLITRVRPAENHYQGKPPAEEQWLICEWPEGEKEPAKFVLCTLPVRTSKRALVRLARTRWRVERDYEDLKGEVGLDHFEGRGWRGFHHHATLCAAAHAFLVLRQVTHPPQHRGPEHLDAC
jgi:SRSO17 transposase